MMITSCYPLGIENILFLARKDKILNRAKSSRLASEHGRRALERCVRPWLSWVGMLLAPPARSSPHSTSRSSSRRTSRLPPSGPATRMPSKNSKKGCRTPYHKKPRKVIKKKVHAFGPPQGKRRMVVVPVDLDPYLVWLQHSAWAAVSSHCRADSRSHSLVVLPVLSVQIFGGMVMELLGALLLWLLGVKDPRISLLEEKGERTWRLRLSDPDELSCIFNFSVAKADGSVATARASKKQNYNALVEVQLVHRRKLCATTWARREFLEVEFWYASMNQLGAVTLPAGRYSAADVAAIEMYMRTLTVQARQVDKQVHKEIPDPYTAEGPVSCPAPGCGFSALDHATAWRLRAKLTACLESDTAAHHAHAAQHFGQLWPPKLCLPSRACIAPLLHLMENAFQYMHDKLVWARIELYANSLTGLSKADKTRLIAEIKGEAARILAACGVENAMSKGTDGTLDKPCFQGGEVKALLCSRAFYNYIAYVVQQTSPTQPLPAPPPQSTAARASAARASTPPSRPQVVAGIRIASHYANLAYEPDSEEEDGLSPESVAEAAARWELDIAAVTGATQQILLVLRAFVFLSQYFEHITSTDYNDALAEARKAHADAAEQLACDFLTARLRAARGRADVLKLRRHRRAHRLEEHPRPRASAGLRARGRHGEEEPGSQENLQARGLPHPPLQLLRVEFNRTSALQLAEALAVREVSVFRAAAYVAHYAQSYQGQQLAQLLAAGAQVKR
mmetsp:Transcript_24351/g.60583  ORF Transcript_24351/g.60583 Transcript_24351/m.60583 type:complete len:736 (-) Transcript_24351:243-2450(-)